MQLPDAGEQTYRIAGPLLLLACFLCAAMASVGQNAPGRFLWSASAIFTASSSWSALLAYGVPYKKLAIRLNRVGAALAVLGLIAKLCGVKQWTQPSGEYRYIVFLYKTNCFSGEVTSSDEGEAFWCPREELESLDLAEGFDIMLPVFEKGGTTEVFYTIENDEWLHHYR